MARLQRQVLLRLLVMVLTRTLLLRLHVLLEEVLLQLRL